MKQSIRILAAILLVTALLAGCSGGGAKPTTSPGSDPAPAPAPKGPVKLVIGVHQDIQHWDLHNHNFTFTEAVHQNVFDYLVRMNAETGEFAADLAVSWKTVEPTVWEFKLREGVKFHNGDPFTAEDVKFTVERVATDKNLKEQRTMSTVKEVRILDPQTVQIVTHKPDPALLSRLSRIGSGIMPKKYWDSVGGVDGWQKAPVGTGPFKFKSWVKDDSITLEAFTDHWRGKPSVDEVVFRVLPETASRMAELQSGGIDIALKLGADDIKTVKSDLKLEALTPMSNRVYLLMLRTQPESATADPRVREAIELAIDRQVLIDTAAPGLGTPTRSRNTPGIIGADPTLYQQNPHDLERAKKLLAEAGHSGGLKIGLLARTSGTDAVVAQSLTAMLEKAGFQVDLEMIDPAAFNKKLAAATNPDIYLTAFGNSMKDAELSYTFMTTAIDVKRLGYTPKDAIEILEASKSEMDPVKRTQMLQQLAQRVAADRPQIALFQIGDVHGIRKGVTWKPTRDEMVWVYGMEVSK